MKKTKIIILIITGILLKEIDYADCMEGQQRRVRNDSIFMSLDPREMEPNDIKYQEWVEKVNSGTSNTYYEVTLKNVTDCISISESMEYQRGGESSQLCKEHRKKTVELIQKIREEHGPSLSEESIDLLEKAEKKIATRRLETTSEINESLSDSGKISLLRKMPAIPKQDIGTLYLQEPPSPLNISRILNNSTEISGLDERNIYKKNETIKENLKRIYQTHIEQYEALEQQKNEITAKNNVLTEKLQQEKEKLEMNRKTYEQEKEKLQTELVKNISSIEHMEEQQRQKNEEMPAIQQAVENTKIQLYKQAEQVYETWKTYVTKKNIKRAAVIGAAIGTAVIVFRYLRINPVKMGYNATKNIINKLTKQKTIEAANPSELLKSNQAPTTVSVWEAPLSTAAKTVEEGFKNKTPTDKAAYAAGGLGTLYLARNAISMFSKFKK